MELDFLQILEEHIETLFRDLVVMDNVWSVEASCGVEIDQGWVVPVLDPDTDKALALADEVSHFVLLGREALFFVLHMEEELGFIVSEVKLLGNDLGEDADGCVDVKGLFELVAEMGQLLEAGMPWDFGKISEVLLVDLDIGLVGTAVVVAAGLSTMAMAVTVRVRVLLLKPLLFFAAVKGVEGVIDLLDHWGLVRGGGFRHGPKKIEC